MMNIVKAVKSIGMTLQPTVFICEENKNEISDLISILKEYIDINSKVHAFLQDYRGNGENLEGIRLTKQSYEKLPVDAKGMVNISRYKTESEWLQSNDFSKETSRNLKLSLLPNNINSFENMSCDEIIEYLVELDEKYYSAIPNIYELAKLYGNKENQRLYRQRDLCWKWQKQYIKDNNLSLHNVTDERICGSIRF
jgi:hypothetical protein